ncbi:hypothetical protein TSAR_014667 [Trichomalopsis sarcophagae]|uniref:Secreted protein n=1 Tax=Trichomalopsis sarcophagae TaxID=543379 RepID=A0A232F8N8_9HYME|nr:hypothetical protein TSAR_014667 [Trichomalopsis sarcophagae]
MRAQFVQFLRVLFWCHTIISERLLSIGLKMCVRTSFVIVRCQIYFGLDPACIRRMRSHQKIAKNDFWV